MKSHTAIVEQFKKHKALSESGLRLQRNLARECNAFYVGDTMKYSGKVEYVDQAGAKRRAMVEFNRVKPYVNAVAGFMLQNRREAKYVARLENENVQRLFTDYANSIKDYCRENGNADMAEAEANKQMLIGGVGAIETCLSYGDGYASTDPNGEIVWTPLSIHEVGYDPRARRQNLLDSRWVYYAKEYDRQEALDMFDNSSEGDFEGVDDGEQGNKGSKVFDQYSRRLITEQYDWVDEDADIVKVYFYQWYEIEKYWRCENPAKVEGLDPEVAMQIAAILQGVKDAGDDDGFDPTADIVVCSPETRKAVDEAFEGVLDVDWFDIKRKVFYTAVLSGKKVFSAYKSISQSGFSVQFITGDWDEERKVWDGMVSAMRDPVRYYNKTVTELMFTIAANSKGGWFVEENAVEDIREFEANASRTDAVLQVKDGALAAGKIQSKTKPFQPTGYENIVAISDAAIGDVSGVDKTFLGNSDNKQETATLHRQRVSQVVATLAGYFDAVGLYEKMNSRIMLDLMRVYAENNPSALVPIIGEDGKTQFLRLSREPFMAEYSISIQEAPISAYEKQELSGIASTMGQQLIAVGDVQSGKALMALALKYTQFNESDKQEIIELLQPQEGEVDPMYVQQLEQQLQALQSEMSRIQAAKVISDTELNNARAQQTMADVQKKVAETAKTIADAEKVDVETRLASRAASVSVVV